MNQPDVQIYSIEDMATFQEFAAYVKEEGFSLFTLDCETDSKSEKKAKLYGVGLCFARGQAVYIPIRRPDGTSVWTQEQERFIAQWIFNQAVSKRMVGHNISYDVLVLEYNWGIDLSPHIYSDTILLKHAINEEQPFALKEVAVNYLGPWADKAQDALKDNVLAKGGRWNAENKDMYLADTAILAEYCGYDCLLTMYLYNIFSVLLHKEGLEKLFYEEETMPLYREVTIDMKRKGFHIDVPYYEKLKAELTFEILGLRNKVMEQIDPLIQEFVTAKLDKEVPVKKGGAFPKALADALGVELPKNKKTGAITLATKELTTFRDAQSDLSSNSYLLSAWLLSEIEDHAFPLEAVQQAQAAVFFSKQAHEGLDHIFNLASSTHLGWLFFEKLGEKPLSYTEHGKPQCDDDFLDTVAEKYEFVKTLIDFKKLEKLLSTYVVGILDRQIDGIIYTSMLQFGTISGRYASRDPNCLSMDTEVLTDSGFKKQHEIAQGDRIAAFDPKTKRTVWQHPTKIWVSEEKEHSIVSVKNQHFDMKMTDNHRCLFRDRKSKVLRTYPASKFLKDSSVLHGAAIVDNIDIFEDINYMRLCIAVQADGHVRKDCDRVIFVFSKKRKYKRLLEILSKLNYEFVDSRRKSGQYEISIKGLRDSIVSDLGEEKTFPSVWLLMSTEERSVFLDEIFHWDGCLRSFNYSSNNVKNVDFIQALCSLHGNRAHKRVYRSKRSKEDNWQLDITHKDNSHTANAEITKTKELCKVWCLEVPTSYFIVRRGSDTFITGNCQNLPRIKDEGSKLSPVVLKYTNAIKKGFIAPKGYKIVNADYSALEPVCFAHMSGDEKLRNVFRKKHDLYSQIAIDLFGMKQYSADKKSDNYLGTHNKEARQAPKVFCLAVVYGAEASRISQAMKITYKEAQDIITSYLNAFPNLRKYMETCNSTVKASGKVQTEFGRIRHLPKAKRLYEQYGDQLFNYHWAKENNLTQERREFKNALNNAKNMPIQGLAAHIVNRAMIATSRAFKQHGIEGYIGLQVHDEITCIVREDQAELAVKLLQNAMENTTKISVPLVAEPKVAQNWAEAK